MGVLRQRSIGVVTRLSNDPVADALAAAAEIAARSPSGVRGDNQFMNRISATCWPQESIIDFFSYSYEQ